MRFSHWPRARPFIDLENGSDYERGSDRQAPSRLYNSLRQRARRGGAAAVWQRQVGLRAHLDQAGGRALELLRLEVFPATVERVGLGCRGGDELHGVVVERVDQNDEAFRSLAGLPH